MKLKHSDTCRCHDAIAAADYEVDERCVRAARDAEVASLRAALERYGAHHHYCILSSRSLMEAYPKSQHVCDCGLDGVRAALSGRGPEARGDDDDVTATLPTNGCPNAGECCGPFDAECPRLKAPPSPDWRGLLEAVDAVEEVTSPYDDLPEEVREALDALAAKRKEWPL